MRPMKTFLIAYAAAAISMLGLDAIWLGITGPRLYRPRLGDMMLPSFNLLPAALFYLVYVLGIVLLAVQPAIGEGRASAALLRGGLLGLVAYATYDLTNQATLKGWPVAITIADLCWGTCLTAVAATVGYLVATRFAGAT
jgi:uncharacterized membrane protein